MTDPRKQLEELEYELEHMRFSDRYLINPLMRNLLGENPTACQPVLDKLSDMGMENIQHVRYTKGHRFSSVKVPEADVESAKAFANELLEDIATAMESISEDLDDGKSPRVGDWLIVEDDIFIDNGPWEHEITEVLGDTYVSYNDREYEIPAKHLSGPEIDSVSGRTHWVVISEPDEEQEDE